MAEQVKIEEIKEVQNGGGNDGKLGLETLVGLMLKTKLDAIADASKKQIKELQKRQSEVRELHDAMRAINAYDQGDMDISKDDNLKKLLKRAKELGVEIKEDKMKYTAEDRSRLVENIRMSVEDRNMENDMQLQGLTRLTSELYEAYQLARSILKPLHDDKMNKTRAMVLR